MNIVRIAAFALALAGLGACVTVAPPIGSDFRAPSQSVSILVMEPDVQVTFITTGGAERRADWSEQAKSNLMNALMSELAESGERAVLYNAAEHQTEGAQQALLLNQAVTDALAAHVIFMDISTFAGRLPHQQTQPETYTLGQSVRDFAPETEADYALFLTSRSQIESGGMFMTKVLIGAVTGYVPASTAFRGAYVSLVDLRTGEVVWLRGHNLGDARNAQEAASIMNEIFDAGPLAAVQ
jgi:hypothetical protein